MEIIKLEYTEAFVKRSVRSYWWKQVGTFLLATIAAMAILLFYLLQNGDRSWLVGLLAAIVALSIAVLTASYLVHLRRALLRLSRMKKPEATLELTENRFCVASDVGKSEFEWSIIKQVWKFEEVWLLFFSAGEFMTLPTNDIPERHKEFIIRNLKESGAKIL